MVSIPGHFEYDDDELTPGNKKEGGLHQNLYDSDGKLKGNARFIPGDADEPDAAPSPADLERARLAAERDRAITEIVSLLVDFGVAWATPRVKKFSDEKVRPVIASNRDRLAGRRMASKIIPAGEPIVVDATVVEPSTELIAESEDSRPHMSLEEAQARYLLALATKAFSDEQMRILSNARIDDSEGFAELQRVVSELSPEQVADILEKVQANPSLLRGGTLDQLLKILRMGQADVRPVPIEERADR